MSHWWWNHLHWERTRNTRSPFRETLELRTSKMKSIRWKSESTHMKSLFCAQHLGVDFTDPSEPGSDKKHQTLSQQKLERSASFLQCFYLSSLVSTHNFLQFRERMNLKEAAGKEEMNWALWFNIDRNVQDDLMRGWRCVVLLTP